MAAPRKKYRITGDGVQVGPIFRSVPSVYNYVHAYVSTIGVRVAIVWIDEGYGWRRYEEFDFAKATS